MTWADIDRDWGAILEILRANLKVNDEIAMNRKGDFVPASRPMIEDIICAKASRDDLLIEYMRAAGITVMLGGDRPPRIIELGTVHKLRFGHGGKGEKK